MLSLKGKRQIMMSWILDVLLIALVAGTILFYWRRGFVKAVLGFGRALISVVIAWLCGPKLGAVIADKVIGNKIAQKVYDLLCSMFDSAVETVNLQQLFDHAPESFVKIVERLGGSMAELEAQYGDMTAATHETLFELAQSIAAPITMLISNLVGYVLVFIIAFVLLLVFSGLLEKIFKLPLLKQLNHLLGFLLGIVIAMLYAVLFCFLGAYLLNLIGAATGKFIAEELIAGTSVFRLIANIKLF